MASKEPKRSSQSILPVMIIGAIIVAALLAFSLRRLATSREQSPAPQASATASQPPTTASEVAEPTSADVAHVARIKPAELRDLIARNAVTVIDVRDADSFLSAHIPGALHIPMARIDGEIPYLPKDKPIVTYCT